MQLATPFLIPSATVVTQRSQKTKVKANSQNADHQNSLVAQPVVDQTAPLEVSIETPNELAHQNLARLLASCGDCV